MQAPLRARFRDLPTVDTKEIIQQRMFEDNTYKTPDQEEARKKKRKRRESPRTPPGSPTTQPPPPPPPAGVSGAPVKLQVHPRLQPQLHNLWLGRHLTLNMSQ
ncbi:hypothetical protein Tco_0325249, partial [Tanacetum coccineum]